MGDVGTVVGCVSLGIQLHDKITKYVEDYKSRDERLLGLHSRSEHLKLLLDDLNQRSESFASVHAKASHIVSSQIARCKVELRALEDLVDKLIPSLPSTNDIKGKMKETVKKVKFPFNSDDIEKLEARLDRTTQALSLAVNCLQLHSQDSISAGQNAIHSDVIRYGKQIEEVHSFMMLLKSNSLPRQQGTQVMTMALMQPSASRELRDVDIDVASTSSSMLDVPTHQDGSMIVPTKRARACPQCGFRRRQIKYRRMTPFMSSISLLEEVFEERHHHPSCERSQWQPGRSSHTIALQTTALVAWISRAVSIGFFRSYGGGGYNIGPALQCRRMVNSQESPAFIWVQRMELAMRFCWNNPETMAQVVAQGLPALQRIFGAKRALPTDIDECGATLATLFCFNLQNQFVDNESCWELMEAMIDLGIPTQGIMTSTAYADPIVHSLLFVLVRVWPGEKTSVKQRGAQLSRLAACSAQDFIAPSRSYIRNIHPLALLSLSSEFHDSIAEVYGVDSPLAEALIQKSEKHLQTSLKQAQAMNKVISLNKDEAYLLDLALLWPSGLQIILASPSATNIDKLLDDGEAVERALMTSVYLCHGIPHSWAELCDDECICSRSLQILLECRSYLGITFLPRDMFELRAKVPLSNILMLISHVKESRDKLTELARSELPLNEQADLGLDANLLLDHQVDEVVARLKSRGIFPYQQLGLRADISCHYGGSIHHRLRNRPAASSAFHLGFRDIDCVDEDGLTPLAWIAQEKDHHLDDASYVRWLLENGADFTRVFRYRLVGAGKLHPRHTIAHRLMLGSPGMPYMYEMYAGPDIQQDYVWVCETLWQVKIRDECDCACTGPDGGCSPLLVFLKQYSRRLEHLSPSKRLDIMQKECSRTGITLEPLCGPLIRLLAFEGLGLRHTCCVKFAYNYYHNEIDTSCSDDFEEIRAEDEPLFDELELLVAELTAQFEQSDLDIFSFLEAVAMRRIREVAAEFEGAELTQEQERCIEGAGVILRYGPDKLEEPKKRGRFDLERAKTAAFWADEFDRIANGDLSDPFDYE